MSVVAMQKVAVLAHKSLREELLNVLQDLGLLEVTERRAPSNVDHTEVQFREAELQFAIQTLKEVASKETHAAANKRTTIEGIVFAAQHTDVRGVVDELHKLEEHDTQAQRRMQELALLEIQLEPWIALPIPLDTPRESAHTIRVLGLVPTTNLQHLETALTQATPRTVLMHIGERDGVASIAAMIWKGDLRLFEEIATTWGWTSVELPAFPAAVTEAYEECRVEHKTLEQSLRKSREARIALSVELPNLVKTATFLQWLDSKQSVREAMAETSDTITLLGWVPKRDLANLEQHLTTFSKATALLKVKSDQGEEAPVLLKNPLLLKPFESVTNLYGLPLPTEMDPTRALSPFFILYFALCLTDAGYGATIALIFGIVLWKTRKSIDEARLLWLLFFAGIVTFFVSIPFGGWFGLTPEQVPAFLTKQTAEGLFFRGQAWNLGKESGITFLQNLSLVLGLTHLFFGMFLAGWHKWIHGNKAAALWQDFTSHLLLGSVLFYVFAPEALAQIAPYVLYAAIALIIWGKGYGSPWYLRPVMGVIGMMNFTIGMISNSLSYLRILALGLVTGAIAAAVNQVAVEIGKLFPIWLAIPIVIIICVGGHLVSIALNTLGSFIHSGRLQFIEFFSQFFEGGGREFAPFKRAT